MNKEFQNIVLPVIKGLPILCLFIAIGLYAGRRIIQYSNTIYQANSSIKIDNRDESSLDVQVFNSGVMPTLSNKQNFLTEVEVFKSKQLRKETFKKLNFGINYYRIGEIKEVELYHNVPFSIEYTILDSTCLDKLVYLKYKGNNQFALGKDPKNITADSLLVGKTYVNSLYAITLTLNKKLIDSNPECLVINDVFAFKLNSLKSLVASVGEENFFVKPVDKEISILKIYYKHEIPKKAALFVNALMETYMESNRIRKSNRSGKTLSFINDKLRDTSRDLKDAEANLAAFKSENNLVNANQETDAALKEIMQLEMQKVGIDLQKAELQNLFTFIETGGSLNDFSPNFEALKDGVLKDAYLKVQAYELQRIDLLNKYAIGSEEIRTVDEKSANLRSFIGASVRKTLSNLDTKEEEIAKILAIRKTGLQRYPDKERQLAVLEREVKINEQFYNHLMEKQTEFSIAKTSEISLHQVIDKADVPTHSLWPNKPLIYGVCLFFALFAGLMVCYLIHYFMARVNSKNLLSYLVDVPLLATVRKQKKNKNDIVDSYSNLYTNLEILKKNTASTRRAQVVSISSMKPKEGKTHTSVNLAKTASIIGKKVLLVDLDMRKPDLYKKFDVANEGGVSAILRGDVKIKEAILEKTKNLHVLLAGNLKNIPSAFVFSTRAEELVKAVQEDYDLVIFDTPPLGMVPDAMLLMQISDVNLFVVRRKSTKVRTARALDALISEWQIPNTFTILNCDKQQSSNYYSPYNNTSKQANDLALDI